MRNRNKMLASLQKELTLLEKKERNLENTALKAEKSKWKIQLENKIPAKVFVGIESAFCKAFAVVFDQGRALIEKSYNKNSLSEDHSIRDYAVLVKGSRREIRKMSISARKSSYLNLAVTTLEGMGLGALGIGLPDIVLFISTLLKGVYETAVNFGFDYAARQEQYLILKMLYAALSTGEDWSRENKEIDAIFRGRGYEITDEEFEKQLKKTASAFAVDMLILKFVQGLPVIGLVAGAANPVYYNKVLRYVHLKYQKHYMINKLYQGKDMTDELVRTF